MQSQQKNDLSKIMQDFETIMQDVIRFYFTQEDLARTLSFSGLNQTVISQN